jgi:C4-dicarboxylate transporter DctQ subunit
LRAIVNAYNALITGLAVLAGLIIAAIFFSIVVDVLMRTAGLQPPPWTITYVEYGLLYFTMCCAPFLVRHKGHVLIEAFVTILPVPVRRVLEKVVYALCLCGALVFAYESVLLFLETWQSGRIDVRGVDISMWILFVPMPISYAAVAIEFGRYLFGNDTLYTYNLSEVKDSI